MRASPKPALSEVETWVFDLDNTLYPARHNLFDLVDARIGAYIARLLGTDAVAARRLQKRYFRDYGTTLRGLMLRHGVIPEDFLAFVHAIPIERLPADPALDHALSRLGGRKVVFTNASAAHAERVLARLGIARHFDGIFDIVAAEYVPKPEPAAYRRLLARHRIVPERAVMVEDIARNLAPAADLGMTTVWVDGGHAWGAEGRDGPHIDHVIDDLTAWLGCLTGAGEASGGE